MEAPQDWPSVLAKHLPLDLQFLVEALPLLLLDLSLMQLGEEKKGTKVGCRNMVLSYKDCGAYQSQSKVFT
jgi:hypothetical protein